ncbi:MAG: M23 family metallopeptidase, partial [Bacteroidota bacterium]
NYLTSDTLIKTEVTPLFVNNIPDSMILDVDHARFEENAVERLAFLQDGLVLDSVWLTKFDYFQTWSSNTVNPYQARTSDLPDSVVIQLYDEAKEKGWSSPLDTAIVNSYFGFRRWRYHNGIDLDLEIGDLVRSAFGGVVRISSYNRRGFGHYIVIRHENGLETLYGHLKEKFVTPGQYVEPGQLIGYGGNSGRSTGPHLHFEVRYQGFPIDPSEVFDFKKNAPKSDVFVWNTQKLKRTGHSSSTRSVQSRTATRNSQGVRVYKVRSGDSLWVIARRHNTTVNRICQINGLSRTATLRIGQQLRLD